MKNMHGTEGKKRGSDKKVYWNFIFHYDDVPPTRPLLEATAWKEKPGEFCLCQMKSEKIIKNNETLHKLDFVCVQRILWEKIPFQVVQALIRLNQKKSTLKSWSSEIEVLQQWRTSCWWKCSRKQNCLRRNFMKFEEGVSENNEILRAFCCSHELSIEPLWVVMYRAKVIDFHADGSKFFHWSCKQNLLIVFNTIYWVFK